jgi:alpha-galactosidase
MAVGFLFCALLTPSPSRAWTNGLALTPPMGFNTWYAYALGFNEQTIHDVVDAMATNGLLAAGYNYICLDDGWAGYRDANGFIFPDPAKFPSGMKALADYIHGKGFKMGLYTTFGARTCGQLPGTCGHVEQDVSTYAAWGIDYLKYEGCTSCTPNDDLRSEYERMSKALATCGRPILFNGSIDRPAADWMPAIMNSWRGTGDNFHGFWNILQHLDFVARTPGLAGPGQWNDPDVLEVGHAGISREEARANFTMWCMVAAPLLIATVDVAWLDTLTNRELIAVDQDPAGIQGYCVKTNGDLQVWIKPLANERTLAVALLNRGSQEGQTQVDWEDLGLIQVPVIVRDLWAKAPLGVFSNSFSCTVPPHGVRAFRIDADETLVFPPSGTNSLNDLIALAETSLAAPPIRNSNSTGAPLRVAGVQYTQGLGVQGTSQCRYFIGPGSGVFSAMVGLDDATVSTNARVVFRVFGDGELLFESEPMAKGSPAREMRVDLSGRAVLKLETARVGDPTGECLADWVAAEVAVSPSAPATPSHLEANSLSNVSLSWHPVPGAEAYLVQRAFDPGGPYATTGLVNVARFVDTNVVPDTVYFYKLVATNYAGESGAGGPVRTVLPAIWAGGAGGPVALWRAAGNWTNASSFPDEAGKGAVLTRPLQSNLVIRLTSTTTAGSLVLGDASGHGAYRIEAATGQLILDNAGSAPALIQSTHSAGDIIACPVDVRGTLVISNFSQFPLLLEASNSLTAGVWLGKGTLKVANGSALGTNSSLVEVSGVACLDLNGQDLRAKPIGISGTGPVGAGRIVNSSLGNAGSLSDLTLDGDAVVGGTGDWELISQVPGTASFLRCRKPAGLTKIGGSSIRLIHTQVDTSLGDVNLREGRLVVSGVKSFGNPAAHLLVSGKASLGILSNSVLAKAVDFHGMVSKETVTASGGTSEIAGAVNLEEVCTFRVDDGVLHLSGPTGGGGGLFKTGLGALTLGGTLSFQGELKILEGKVSFATEAVFGLTNGIQINAGAELDVSHLPGFTVAAGQELAGGGAVIGNVRVGAGAVIRCGDGMGTFTFNNSLALEDGSTCRMRLDFATGTSDRFLVHGNLKLAGTLDLAGLNTNAISPDTAFQIFEATGYEGSFARVLPVIPARGFLWDLSTLGTDGKVRVRSGSLPSFTSVAVRQGQLFLTGNPGSFGLPGGAFVLRESTVLTSPVDQWIPVLTNFLDSSGTFSIQIPVDPTSKAKFFSLHLSP